jgi:hypothetical protein
VNEKRWSIAAAKDGPELLVRHLASQEAWRGQDGVAVLVTTANDPEDKALGAAPAGVDRGDGSGEPLLSRPNGRCIRLGSGVRPRTVGAFRRRRRRDATAEPVEDATDAARQALAGGRASRR